MGPAAVGKTTLLRALLQQDPRIVAGTSLRRGAYASSMIAISPVLVHLLLRRGLGGKWLTWEHTRSMAYLDGWHRVLRRDPRLEDAAIVLNHGPIHRLALLRAFGPGVVRSDAFEAWWNRMFNQWAAALNMIVSLEAPDPVLYQRVHLREHRSRAVVRPEKEADEFLALYRRAYREIITNLSLTATVGPLLLRFDTHRNSPDQISGAVLAEIDSWFAKSKPRAPQ